MDGKVNTSSGRRDLADLMHNLLTREDEMLFLVVLLVALWLLGMVTTYTLGGALHILLVIAIVFLLIHLIQGRSISNI